MNACTNKMKENISVLSFSEGFIYKYYDIDVIFLGLFANVMAFVSAIGVQL